MTFLWHNYCHIFNWLLIYWSNLFYFTVVLYYTHTHMHATQNCEQKHPFLHACVCLCVFGNNGSVYHHLANLDIRCPFKSDCICQAKGLILKIRSLNFVSYTKCLCINIFSFNTDTAANLTGWFIIILLRWTTDLVY